MIGYYSLKTKLSGRTKTMQTWLKCIQINLQHSTLLTNNLLKIIEEEALISYAFKNHIRFGAKSQANQINTKASHQEKEDFGQL
jgi:hypothetical protein